MANWQVISLDTTTPQLRAPGTGDGYSFNSGSTQLGVWTTTGLGIGTASPSYSLSVENSSATQLYLRGAGAGFTQASILLASNTTSTPEIRALGTYMFNEGTDNTFYAGTLYNSASSWGIGVAAGATFQTSAADAANAKIVVTSTGNVGIGTVSPGSSSRLVVRGAGTTNATFSIEAATSGGATRFLVADDGLCRWYGTSNAETMRLDNAGNLAIGTTSPGVKLDVQGVVPFIRLKENTTGYLGFRGQNDSGNFYFGIDNSSGSFYGSAYARVLYAEGAYPMVFYTNATERARITAGGALCVNSTSNVGSEITLFKQTAGTGSPVTRTWNNSTSGNNEFIEFATESSYTSRGSITYNRTAGLVSYNTTSDVRLKENIADAEEAGSKIDAMQVRQFDWKETGNHLDYGFVAQELHAVAPYAVSKPEDDDKMWSVDYSKLVPMLVKEIQSLRARVAQLEAK